jgi:hypothetical protein
LNFDGTSVRFRNPACDGEPQPNTSKLARASLVDAVKPIKNVRHIFYGNTNSGVSNFSHGGIITALKPDGD